MHYLRRTCNGQCSRTLPVAKTGDDWSSNEFVIWIPDPYSEEINGDDTCYWLCESCAAESAMDI